VFDLLSGLKTNDFKLGYHIVKSRGQHALNDGRSIREGLDEEEAFFRMKEPWKAYPDKKQMGTNNLRESLSKLQVEMMKREVPNILVDVDTQLIESRKRIYDFGQDISC